VVPRTWTHLLAQAAGLPIDPGTPTPAAWRDYVARRTCLPAPTYMTEGAPGEWAPFESGYDPGDPVDYLRAATVRSCSDVTNSAAMGRPAQGQHVLAVTP
jgi:acetoin utilization protein AcuC